MCVGNHFFPRSTNKSECLFNDKKGMYRRKRAGKKKNSGKVPEFIAAWLFFYWYHNTMLLARCSKNITAHQVCFVSR